MNPKIQTKQYQAIEFARIAGVTVRTLHHYDRIGLLKPSGYTQAGYRLYRDQDLIQLQQIVTLKFIGFSLNQIKNLLSSNSFDLSIALSQQKEIISEKRQRLDLAINALGPNELASQFSKALQRCSWRFHTSSNCRKVWKDLRLNCRGGTPWPPLSSKIDREFCY